MSVPPREYLRATMSRTAMRIIPAVLVLILWISGHERLALALFCTVSALVAYLVLSPYTRLLGPVTTQMPDRETPLITIDDGPHPETTPALLDLLDEHQTKAVFFVVGDRVNQWPDLAREIVRRGHVIGNHTMTHPAKSFWMLGPRGTWREIADCQQAIQQATGVEARWFRAPVGHYNFFTHPALRVLNLQLMSWSARGLDGVDSNADRIVNRIIKHLRPGSIVLLHEGRPGSLTVAERVLSVAATAP